MRLVRIAVVVLLCVCGAFYFWATARYNEANDTQAPQIHCENDYLRLSVEDDPSALMQGLTASDAQDGDLTGEILLAAKSTFQDQEPGVFWADYVVFDSHQNFCQLTRKIHYTDYTSPEFGLSQPLIFSRGENIRYLNYVTAHDVLDGDISDQIKVLASDVSNYTAGTYPVLLEVSNSFGDTVQVELMVEVRDKNSHNVSISLSQYLVYIAQGEAFDPYGMISSVAGADGVRLPKENVRVLGTVDTQTPGCYQLIYSYTDNGNKGETRMTVVVTKEVA